MFIFLAWETIKATNPETSGVAIEVPDRLPYLLLGKVDKIFAPGAASDTQPDYQKTIRSTNNIVQDAYNSPTYQKTQLSTKNIVEHTRKKLEIKQIEREKMLYERTVANLEKLTSEIGKKVSLLHDLLQQRNLIHNNSSNMQPLASNINILTSQISAVKKDLAQHEKNLRR